MGIRDTADRSRELLTVNEVMTRMGVSRRTIYNWMKAGKLETARTPSGNPRIYADCLLVKDRPAEPLAGVVTP